MKALQICMILMLIAMMSGCQTTEPKPNQEASPNFTSGNTVLQGVEGRIAILGPGFTEGKTNKYMWHFWGAKQELSDKRSFKVEAVNLKSGVKSKALVRVADTNDSQSVWQYDTALAGPNNGAGAHLPSNMMLPAPGLWRLDAYLDDRLFGSVTVEVKKD